MADVNWSYGSLVTPETPPEPESLGSDDSIGDLLDAAEDIVNAAAPDVMAEVEAERRRRRGSRGSARGSKSKGKKKGKGGRGPSSGGGGLGERFRRRYRDGG